MIRVCAECKQPMPLKYLPTRMYCGDACRNMVAKRKWKKRNADQALEYRAGLKTVAVVEQEPPIERAKSLAETQEIPAANAWRGEMLTGGATAAGYGQAVGIVKVGE